MNDSQSVYVISLHKH